MAGSGGGGVQPILRNVSRANEVGIVFLHHATDVVTLHHYDLIRRHNPGVPVVTVSGSHDRLKGGFVAKHLTWDRFRWWRETKGGARDLSWMFSDLMLYGAYASRPVQCERWVVFEWDVLCTMHVEDAFRTVWDADLSAAYTFTHEQKPDWYWFTQHMAAVPPTLRSHAAAAAPFGVLMCSDRLLRHICDELPKWPTFQVQNEFRIGTLCRYFGMSLRSCEVLKGTVSDNPKGIKVRRTPGIYHPVKRVVS